MPSLQATIDSALNVQIEGPIVGTYQASVRFLELILNDYGVATYRNRSLMDSAWHDKAWGRTRQLIDSPDLHVSLIEVESGGYCSRHLHSTKHNIFAVLSGCLQVTVFEPFPDNHIPLETRALSQQDQPFVVAPNTVHQFLGNERTFAAEAYFARVPGRLRDDDIVRYSVGGNLATGEPEQSVRSYRRFGQGRE